MPEQFDPSDSKRIRNMKTKVTEAFKGHGGNHQIHFMANFKEIKNGDALALEQSFSAVLRRLYEIYNIPYDLKCMIEITKGKDGFSKEKETMEFLFYLNPDNVCHLSQGCF